MGGYWERPDNQPETGQGAYDWLSNLVTGSGWGGGAEWNLPYGSPVGVARQVAPGLIRAFSNQTGAKVGEMGYRELPGAASIRNLWVDPAARGQGYANEMLDLVGQKAGANLKLGSDITNSMGFWERAAQKWPSLQDAVQYMKGGW
jgi:ribosomal protein S18 acetylase RimI-like enzyme